ncbi:MAG: YceI family protein [Chitinophagales bacterium]
MKFRAFILFFSIISAIIANGQNQYTLGSDYKITIEGSSNVHDWEETAQTASGDGLVQWNNDATFSIKQFNLKLSVRSIKSDKGSIMDNKTYEALKADKHPYITFKMLSIKSIVKSGTGYAVKVNGELTIAGVTKNVDINGTVNVKENGKLFIDTSKTIKMTDYGIDPPTAMMGAMKVGNEITIKFKLNYIMKILN